MPSTTALRAPRRETWRSSFATGRAVAQLAGHRHWLRSWLFALGSVGMALPLPAQGTVPRPANAVPPTTAVHAVLGAPPANRKPVIAVLADAAGTELTDFLVPRATLAASGAARVITVAARLGKIPLTPSTITVEPDMTLAAFDSAVPTGADYVIVPAMVDPKNAAVRTWLQAQAAHGAVIVSICEGARVVAGAGLLEGKRATTHWHALDDLAQHYPGTTWVRNARYVVSEGRISTTGVSASLPVSLYLIERIAGRAVADSAARALGVAAWDTAHDTDAFQLSRWMYLKAATTYLVRRPREVIAVPVANGVDEVALAFTLDAIPRTMRAKSLTWSANGESIVSRQGLRISVDAGPLRGTRAARQLVVPSVRPATALDSAIAQLGAWYGADARELIAVGMEYRLRPPR